MADKRVSIVGFASSSLHMVPWQEPDMEFWGLNQVYQHFERKPSRWFEIHGPENREDVAVPTYLEDLKKMECPIYMIDRDPNYPNSVPYPLDDVVKLAGRKYFTSTAAYMIALAILEGFREIHIYGIDAVIGSEYEYQKACIEWWCGMAQGKGIKVVVPNTSALLKSPFLYGYEPMKTWPRVMKFSEDFINSRIQAYKKTYNEGLEGLHKLQGSIEELEALVTFAVASGRGSRYPTLDGSEKTHELKD